MNIIIPDLVLDRILCHAIGDQKSNKVPEAWASYLMVSPPAHTPRYIRKLLRQTRRFTLADRPTLPLVRAWLSVFSVAELDTDVGTLNYKAFYHHQVDIFNWLCENIRPIAIDIYVIDAASRHGAPTLDRLWQQHCDILPANEFPYSTTAVDNAPDVATLDWWWQKHRQFGLEFKYSKAVYNTFTAKVPLGYLCPDHLAMAHWWRDRAVQDGLRLQLSFLDEGPLLGGHWQEYTLRKLVGLGEHGLLELMQLWAAIVDDGLLPPLAADIFDHAHDPLYLPCLFDVPVLEWWWQRHRSHDLQFPLISGLLSTATKSARIDTLDWIWQAFESSRIEMIRFTMPSHLEITRETYERAMGWWEAFGAEHGLELPKFVWEQSDFDTRDDLQSFWDRARDMSVQIGFSYEFMTTDVDLLAWLTEHRDRFGTYGIRINVPMSFERMWNEHNLDGLDMLLDYYSLVNEHVDYLFMDMIQTCLAGAGAEGDLALLKVWYNHPALHPEPDSHVALGLANEVLYPTLASGNVDFASLWLQYTRTLKYKFSVQKLVDQLCQDDRGGDTKDLAACFRWIVQEFGAVELSAAHVKNLLESSDRGECMRFLEWLAMEGLDQGVTMANEFESKAQWEQIYRVARLSHIDFFVKNETKQSRRQILPTSHESAQSG